MRTLHRVSRIEDVRLGRRHYIAAGAVIAVAVCAVSMLQAHAYRRSIPLL